MGDSDKDREKATLLDASQAASAVTVIKPDSLKQTPSIVVSSLLFLKKLSVKIFLQAAFFSTVSGTA